MLWSIDKLLNSLFIDYCLSFEAVEANSFLKTKNFSFLEGVSVGFSSFALAVSFD